MKTLLMISIASLFVLSCVNSGSKRAPSSIKNKVSYDVKLPRQIAPGRYGPIFMEDFKNGDKKNSAKRFIKAAIDTKFEAKKPTGFTKFTAWIAAKEALKLKKYKDLEEAGPEERMDENNEVFKLLTMLDWMRGNPLELFKQLRDDVNLKRENKFFDKAVLVPNVKSYYKDDKDKLPNNQSMEQTGRTVMIVNNHHVRDALNNAKMKSNPNDNVFSVAFYNPKMDMSVGSEYMLSKEFGFTRDEKIMMRSIMKKSHMTDIKKMVKRITATAIEQSNVKGRIEIVNAIARRVPAEVTREYFGYNADVRSIMRWSRGTQRSFFHNPSNKPAHEERAKRAGDEMRKHLRGIILAQQNPNKRMNYIKEGSILDELLKLDVPKSFNNVINNLEYDTTTKNLAEMYCAGNKNKYKDKNGNPADLVQCIWYERVVANMIGTLVGGIETTQAAITQSIDFFLDNPEIMAGAVAAANRGDHTEVANYVWEALRFRPVNPIVMRYVQEDFTFYGPEQDQKDPNVVPNGPSVKKGDVAFIATLSAMHDPTKVEEPGRFVVGRGTVNGGVRGEKRNNAYYFHLGNGNHKCLGDYVAQALVPQVVMQILQLPNLKRVPYKVQEPKVSMGLIGHHDNIGSLSKDEDEEHSTFPESLVLETTEPQTRAISIADPRFVFEDYLMDFDKNEFRLCLSDIKDTDSFWDGSIDYTLYKGYYNRTRVGAAWDLFYCRLPREFRDCIQTSKAATPARGRIPRKKAQKVNIFEIGNLASLRFNQCKSSLSKREKYFYKTEILKTTPLEIANIEKLVAEDDDHVQFIAARNEAVKKRYTNETERKYRMHRHEAWEEEFKFYDRANHRQTYMNPTTIKAYPYSDFRAGNKLNFYTRVDLHFRKCYSVGSLKASKAALIKLRVNNLLSVTTRMQEEAVRTAKKEVYETCRKERFDLPTFVQDLMFNTMIN